MIHYIRGNLLDADVEALVNPVNCVGVAGKGLAKQFKEAFPANFGLYVEGCRRNEVRVGSMFLVTYLSNPRIIINFPTKDHWRHASQLEWIIDGLKDLVFYIRAQGIRSIALPALGCGNGGLRWNDVRREIEEYLGNIEGVEVYVYEPLDESK